MKKIVFIILISLIIAGCANTNDSTPNKGDIEDIGIIEDKVGGWNINRNLPEMNDMLFDQARSEIVDVTYSPIIKLGIQPVSGQNIMYLTYEASPTSNTKSTYKIVTIFEDLDNNIKSKISNITDFNIMDYLNNEGTTTPEGMMGGWQDNAEQPCLLSKEEIEVFNKAIEGLLGVEYSPIATLASQVVAGTNYAFLANGTSVTEEPITHLYIIKVYADLKGEVTINNICGLDLSKFN